MLGEGNLNAVLLPSPGGERSGLAAVRIKHLLRTGVLMMAVSSLTVFALALTLPPYLHLMHGGPCVSPTPQPNGRVVFGVGHRQPLALLSMPPEPKSDLRAGVPPGVAAAPGVPGAPLPAVPGRDVALAAVPGRVEPRDMSPPLLALRPS